MVIQGTCTSPPRIRPECVVPKKQERYDSRRERTETSNPYAAGHERILVWKKDSRNLPTLSYRRIRGDMTDTDNMKSGENDPETQLYLRDLDQSASTNTRGDTIYIWCSTGEEVERVAHAKSVPEPCSKRLEPYGLDVFNCHLWTFRQILWKKTG